MAALFGGGAVLVAPALAVRQPSWLLSGWGPAVALYLGVLTVGVAYWSYGHALRHLPAPTVITLTLLEPITAALLGVLVVGERLTAAGWTGVAAVVAGLVVTGRAALQPASAPTAGSTVPS
jgi:DME family drug/metabolite transporter